MFLLALSLISALALSATYSEGYKCSEYYVVPVENGYEGDIQCHSLKYYARNITQYFTTNSTFYFLPGVHRLGDGNNITVTDISNITLTASLNATVCNQTVPSSENVIVNCSRCQAGFIFLNISDLEIQGIEFTECGQVVFSTTDLDAANNELFVDVWSGTLVLRSVTNFRMKQARITKSRGYGLLGYDVLGNSSIVNSCLSESKGNKSSWYNATGVKITQVVHGGNMEMHYNSSCQSSVSYFHINHSNITMGESTFYASGLDIRLSCHAGEINFRLHGVILSKNTGSTYEYGGGNVAVEIYVSPNATNSISFVNCRIKQGSSFLGSGIFVAIYRNSTNTQHQYYGSRKIVEFESTTFDNNIANGVGAGLYMRLHYSREINKLPIEISMKNCHFVGNQLSSGDERRGGVAVSIVIFEVIGNKLHLSPQYTTSFMNCTFERNNIQDHPYKQNLNSGTLYVEEHANVTLENCTIRENNSTGIAAVHSYIRFIGHNIIERNEAENGGGILLNDDSVLFLSQNTTVNISHNNANTAGGGIYAQYGNTHAIFPCFFQFDTEVLLNKSLLQSIQVHLENNIASTGTAVYGGGIDACYFLTESDNTPWTSQYLEHQSSGRIFNDTFHYPQDPLAISSDPIRVCLCENQTEACNRKPKMRWISPGEVFNISVVVVGQRYGVVSGIVIANIFSPNGHAKINIIENVQKVKENCNENILTYTMNSTKENINVNLSLTVPDSSSSYMTLTIGIHITACPIGFTLDPTRGQCECVARLRENGISCTAHNHLINRPASSWIGYNLRNNSNLSETDSKQIVFAKNCPRLYCKPYETEIQAFPDHIDQNSQCYIKRSGILCGGCQPHLSNVFGTPRCIRCQHTSHWSTVGIVCGVAIVGIILVFFLMASNFTITEGTINGFIFYANLIEANQDIYFPLETHSTDDPFIYNTMRTFIAWLNLDIGIETCFNNGMNTLEKTWLQFLFPLYIWLIAALLIWLSRKYDFMTRLMKNNGTKLLATLILLSYAKLARAIMISLSSARLPSVDQNTLVWYYDGNVAYFHGKHVFLFLTATTFAVILIPFTLALLFIKHLPRVSSLWIFHRINRLKPLFDAYTGPYRDEYRFWTGFQLLIRVILLVCSGFHLNDYLLLIQIIGTCALLLSAKWLYGSGIYKKRSLDILEAWLLLNLMFWSMMMAYAEAQGLNIHFKHRVVGTFAGLTCLTFCATLCFHAYNQVRYTRMWKKMKRVCRDKASFVTTKLKQKFRNAPLADNVEEDAEGNMSEGASLLANPPPVANYGELRECLIESEED